MTKYLFIFILSMFHALWAVNASGQSSICGQVLDSNTGKPVFYVNVFLENTTAGTTTDSSGFFRIRNIPPGVYTLVVQHVSYQVKTLQVPLIEPDSLRFNIMITPRVIQGKEVRVVAPRPLDWKKNLQKFEKLFLGESENAKWTTIENPEILELAYDAEKDELTASTNDVLRILNRALGYRVYIILRSFRFTSSGGSYRIHTRFEPLKPKDEAEAERWAENRLKTYRGSFKHFLATVARDRFREEKFELYGGHYYISRDNTFIRKLRFDGTLKIVYDGKTVSMITLEEDFALIDKLGNLLTPLAISKSGAWYHERIADMLPWDYHPQDLK